MQESKLVSQHIFESTTKQTLIEGFHFNRNEWVAVNISPHLQSFQNKNELNQIHLGRKPFFESVVPTALELHRTLFQQISSESALDWQALGIKPGDQRLHKAQMIEVWLGHKVALDLIPVFINSKKQYYSVATFLYRNHPIYFASKKIKDLDTLKKYLLSAFTLD